MEKATGMATLDPDKGDGHSRTIPLTVGPVENRGTWLEHAPYRQNGDNTEGTNKEALAINKDRRTKRWR